MPAPTPGAYRRNERRVVYRDREAELREWYAPVLGLPLRMEVTGPDGTQVFRIYDIRREEPDPAAWPAQRE